MIRKLELLVVAVVLVVAAFSTAEPFLFYLLYLAILVIGGSYVLVRLGLTDLEAGYAVSQLHGHVGDRMRVTYTLRNASRIPKLWLEIHNPTTLPGGLPGRAITLAGRTERSWLIRAPLARRGHFRVEPLHARDRTIAANRLLNSELRRAARGDLREVGNAQHLEPRAKSLEPRAYDVRNAAADARIDFVEDQRLPRRVFRRKRLEREHHARQLAAGHDAGKGPEIFSRVRRDEELRMVDAAVAPGLRREFAVVEPDLKAGASHRQLSQERLEVPGELNGGRAPLLRQAARDREERTRRDVELFDEILGALPHPCQELTLARELVTCVDDLLE